MIHTPEMQDILWRACNKFFLTFDILKIIAICYSIFINRQLAITFNFIIIDFGKTSVRDQHTIRTLHVFSTSGQYLSKSRFHHIYVEHFKQLLRVMIITVTICRQLDLLNYWMLLNFNFLRIKEAELIIGVEVWAKFN